MIRTLYATQKKGEKEKGKGKKVEKGKKMRKIKKENLRRMLVALDMAYFADFFFHGNTSESFPYCWGVFYSVSIQIEYFLFMQRSILSNSILSFSFICNHTFYNLGCIFIRWFNLRSKPSSAIS